MQRERAIEQSAVDVLKTRGYLCPKMAGVKGIPDRLCIGPRGEIFFIEFKAPGNVTSLHQEFMIENLKARGVKTIVAYSLNDVLQHLATLNPA